ncbi:hypothetical protein [Mycolicibacterium fortuitum]|uniref:PE-PGRS family protein n=2 Tax=Mycolicibacterium fortuitum TaxID=1766 RepID=A0A0N9Y8B0_MYCFO|nr:hypothetical protein [Mycolicibacterium fortuitum]ALI25587.1 hypothetical protein XA26_17400 [Mycolicibacterium fortuitum]MCA4753799.1 hypothetical protein [Mycolicibacterium fortuitum]MCV7141306.1 hypothetical protein [Mycolicibacterium fortuitum]MDG5774526.1 hypothetical protein [Mycolicibacterium fortuitum]MDG5783901.1 hypothetical protein [Mycolicibacterium fortuitum]
MQLALRPFTTAGIALVGAGVIAVSPLAPPPVATSATTTMSAASVALTASSSFVDPIAYWGEVLELAGTNLSTHFEAAIADPFPVLGQVVENQVGYANTIITALSTTSQRLDAFVKGAYFAGQIEKIKTQLAAGNVASAAQAINGIVINGAIAFYPLLDMTKIPGQIGQNVANVLQTLAMESLTNVGIPGRLGFGALELARNTLASFAWTTQTIVTAAKSGDAVALASAIANAPASLTDGLLNGAMEPHPFPNRPPYRGGTGFLTPTTFGVGAASWTPLDAMIYLPRVIAAAIAPPATIATDVATTDAPLAITATVKPEPTASGEIVSDSALTESQDVARVLGDTAVNVPQANDVSADRSTEPGKAASVPAQRVRTSLRDAADQAGKRVKKLTNGIEKSVKKFTDGFSKPAKKKEPANSGASAKKGEATGGSAASSDKKDKTGSDD